MTTRPVSLSPEFVAELRELTPGQAWQIEIARETYCVMRLEDLEHLLQQCGLTLREAYWQPYAWEPQE